MQRKLTLKECWLAIQENKFFNRRQAVSSEFEFENKTLKYFSTVVDELRETDARKLKNEVLLLIRDFSIQLKQRL